MNIFFYVIYSCDAKAESSAAITPVPQDPSEINLSFIL